MKRILFFLLIWLSSILMATSNVNADAPEVGSTMRIQYNNLRGDSYQYHVSSFDIRSIRPYWKGSLIDGKLKYKLLLGFEKNSSDIAVLDACGDYKISDMLIIRFGQFKVPFDRQFLTPLGAMQFIERGVGGLKPFKRDRGVTIRGNITKVFLTYDFGIFNGTGITKNFNAKNISGENKQKHIFAGRVTINPQGEYGYKLALPDEADEFRTTAGFGFATGQQNNDTTDAVTYCFDVAVRNKGFTAMFEYQNKHIEFPIKKTTTTGITVQAGYFILPKLEPVGRYSNQKIKNGTTTNEMTFGFNYYFAKNNAKLQLNYTLLENDYTSDENKRDNKMQLLYQLVF